MAVAGYIRVSSRSQRDEGDSPANQRVRLEAAGATLIFEDLAISGFKLDQRRKAEGYAALVAAIEEGEVTKLLCCRLDRIGRRDQLVLDLAELCEARGVSFVSLSSGEVDVSTASGWISVKLQTLMAENYSRQLAESITHGYRGAWARGKAARGPLPFHLMRDPEAPACEHRFVPSPAWADAREAVRMALAGEPTAHISAFLRERGHLATRSGLLNWLRNPLLLGHAGAWRSDGVIRIPNAAPALVSDSEFEVIQARLAEHRRRWGANAASRGTARVLALSGICACALCGARLYQVNAGGRLRSDGTRSVVPWRVRCQRDGCAAINRTWQMDALERRLALEHLAPEAARIAEVLVGERGVNRKVRASAETLALRSELRARLKMQEEFRQPADEARIAELRQLLAASEKAQGIASRGFLPSDPWQVRLYRQLWESGAWVTGSQEGDEVDPPLAPERRNELWRSLTDQVLVDVPSQSITRVTWRL